MITRRQEKLIVPTFHVERTLMNRPATETGALFKRTRLCVEAEGREQHFEITFLLLHRGPGGKGGGEPLPTEAFLKEKPIKFKNIYINTKIALYPRRLQSTYSTKFFSIWARHNCLSFEVTSKIAQFVYTKSTRLNWTTICWKFSQKSSSHHTSTSGWSLFHLFRSVLIFYSISPFSNRTFLFPTSGFARHRTEYQFERPPTRTKRYRATLGILMWAPYFKLPGSLLLKLPDVWVTVHPFAAHP